MVLGDKTHCVATSLGVRTSYQCYLLQVSVCQSKNIALWGPLVWVNSTPKCSCLSLSIQPFSSHNPVSVTLNPRPCIKQRFPPYYQFLGKISSISVVGFRELAGWTWKLSSLPKLIWKAKADHLPGHKRTAVVWDPGCCFLRWTLITVLPAWVRDWFCHSVPAFWYEEMLLG